MSEKVTIHPAPPLRCLCTYDDSPPWWMCHYENLFFRQIRHGAFIHARDLTVVPDPRNDPEAVAIIEEAKR